MDPGQVSAETRRTCVTIAVIGSALVLAGAMVGITAQVVSNGPSGAAVVAWGLVAGGLFCGLVLIAASGSPSRGRRRHAATIGQAGTSEEWIAALHPGPGDKPE